jgi:phage terminase small subunit
MPGLKNARHERFAQEVAQGKSAGEAYRTAGYRAADKSALPDGMNA